MSYDRSYDWRWQGSRESYREKVYLRIYLLSGYSHHGLLDNINMESGATLFEKRVRKKSHLQ